MEDGEEDCMTMKQIRMRARERLTMENYQKIKERLNNIYTHLIAQKADKTESFFNRTKPKK